MARPSGDYCSATAERAIITVLSARSARHDEARRIEIAASQPAIGGRKGLERRWIDASWHDGGQRTPLGPWRWLVGMARFRAP